MTPRRRGAAVARAATPSAPRPWAAVLRAAAASAAILSLGAPPAAAEDSRPRSVIPWLERAIEAPRRPTPPAPPRAPGAAPLGAAPEDPAAEDGAARRIDQSAVPTVAAEAVGLVSAGAVGLPVDGWRGVTEGAAAAIIDALGPSDLVAANRLTVRLLGAALERPGRDVASETPPRDLLAARIAALSRFGAARDAADLAAAAGPERALDGLEAALVIGREETVCRAALDAPPETLAEAEARAGGPERARGDGGGAALAAARAYCQAALGDAQGALVSIEATRTLGAAADETALALIEAAAEPALASLVETPASAELTPLRLAALRRIGRALPADFAAAAPLDVAAAALDADTPPRQRLAALERLERAGALPTEALANAFAAIASAESGGVWGRVEAYRAVLDADLFSLPDAVRAAEARAAEGGRRAQMARLLGPALAARAAREGIAGAARSSYSDPAAQRMLRLSGAPRALGLLRRLGQGVGARELNPNAAPAARPPADRDPMEAAINRIADPNPAAEWDPALAAPLAQRAARGDARAGRALAALEAFGAELPPDGRLATGDAALGPSGLGALDAAAGPDVDLGIDLDDPAAPAGRRAARLGAPAAERAFRALTALDAGRAAAPEDLRHALSELIDVGLARSARRIALETILAGG